MSFFIILISFPGIISLFALCIFFHFLVPLPLPLDLLFLPPTVSPHLYPRPISSHTLTGSLNQFVLYLPLVWLPDCAMTWSSVNTRHCLSKHRVHLQSSSFSFAYLLLRATQSSANSTFNGASLWRLAPLIHVLYRSDLLFARACPPQAIIFFPRNYMCIHPTRDKILKFFAKIDILI